MALKFLPGGRKLSPVVNYLQLTSLELQYVSPKLLMCRDLELAVPGTYDPHQPIIRIQSIAPSLQVITSKQRPRKLTLMGKDPCAPVTRVSLPPWPNPSPFLKLPLTVHTTHLSYATPRSCLLREKQRASGLLIMSSSGLPLRSYHVLAYLKPDGPAVGQVEGTIKVFSVGTWGWGAAVGD